MVLFALLIVAIMVPQNIEAATCSGVGTVCTKHGVDLICSNCKCVINGPGNACILVEVAPGANCPAGCGDCLAEFCVVNFGTFTISIKSRHFIHLIQ